MKFKLHRRHGALNSPPVFAALEQGLKTCGHDIVEHHEDVAVIWSVLWKGRMLANRDIYHTAKNSGKKVLIIEVGNLQRGKTWRLSLDHVNAQGTFGDIGNLDATRPKTLGVRLQDYRTTRKSSVLICGQLPESLQWQGMPAMDQWVSDVVAKVQTFTDRKIIVRPHPRAIIQCRIAGVELEIAKKIANSYDDFDIDYDHHCVINHNSGPGVQAAIYGTPVICDSTSLAGCVSDRYENIETICLPDRTEWFLRLCHTEWTVDEISQGIPIRRIF